ncbi:MAG: rod shape-determining protein, partial [Clostridia bacterium]
MSSYKVVIDLGSSYISAVFLGSSFIVKEPSIVALDSSLQEVKAVGSSAVKMFSESYSKVKIARPILEGCIIDFDNGRTLVKYIIKKLLPHIRNFSKISVTCIVPCATTSNDKKKIETALLTLGLRQVAFIEAVLCSSYALFSESNVNKGIVADIGSDCADFAAVYNGNIIAGCTLYYAGKQLTEAILGLVKSKYGIVLDFEEAEKLKLACASLYYNDTSTCVVSGISITSGLTEEVELSAKELYNTVTD